MRTKCCAKCKNQKSVSDFRKTGNLRRPECKKCENEYKVGLRKVAKDKEKNKVGPCDCCGEKKKLVVDHCHKTMRFRGYICQKCNIGIGRLGDTLEGLSKAIIYLSK